MSLPALRRQTSQLNGLGPTPPVLAHLRSLTSSRNLISGGDRPPAALTQQSDSPDSSIDDIQKVQTEDVKDEKADVKKEESGDAQSERAAAQTDTADVPQGAKAAPTQEEATVTPVKVADKPASSPAASTLTPPSKEKQSPAQMLRGLHRISTNMLKEQ